MATSIEFIYYLVIALGVGALVGLEREHHKGDDMVIAGIRTFPLVSLFGFLLAYLGDNASEFADGTFIPYLQLLSLFGIIIVAALAIGLLYIRFEMGVPGLTTPFALVITYLAGLLVGFGLIIEAVVVSVIVTFLLVSKRRLHAYAELLDGIPSLVTRADLRGMIHVHSDYSDGTATLAEMAVGVPLGISR